MTSAHRPWQLIAVDPSPSAGPAVQALGTRPVLAAVGRRSLPHLVEATIIPTILFVAFAALLGPGFAMAAALTWAYVAILRRVFGGRAVPALLLLATLGLTVRTVVGLASGSTFAYFLQPVATTVVLAGVFLGSVVVGRPVIARLAHDFCPISAEVSRRPAVIRLFAGLTVLWAGVHLLNAAATLGMLVSMPVTTFVPVKTAASLGITASAVVVTVWWALRTARREDLVFATARIA